MPLSEQDREWVQAIVNEAATTVLGAAKGYVHEVVKGHAGQCPNVAKLRALVIGAALGCSAAGGGLGVLIANLASKM